jgi:hypothetical protein
MRLHGFIFFCLGALAQAAESNEAVSFNREVRPILSDRCYGCHGPDANKGRKAGLRLDESEGSKAKLKSGNHAIVPFDLAKSAMVERIQSKDADEIMPPPELHRPLSDQEKSILLRWIKQGAKYEAHWAFVAPQRSPQPMVKLKAWPKEEIDYFTLSAMEKQGLQPSPEAEPVTLLRRVSLALTGLPPTPEEVDAYLADQSPQAYEKKVDALLASPRFGENLAVAWLDLSRYADTYGYTGDKDMFAWPWRDWVLEAMNHNMPYNQFLTEQLAGDLLPRATISQKVATAYNRLHRLTFEGGSIAEEFRQDGISDRVITAGYGFMGLTLECSRCHDHKYDPISTKDYYSLAAMFSDVVENGLLPYHGEVPPPFVRLFKPDQETQVEKLKAAVLQAEQDYQKQLRSVVVKRTHEVTVPDPVAFYPFEVLTKTGTPNMVPKTKPATFERHRGDQLGTVELAPGRVGQAMSCDGDGGLYLSDLDKFGRFTPISFSAWIQLGEKNKRATLLHASGFYTNDADASGIELMIIDGKLRWSAIHLWPSIAASIQTKAELPLKTWVHVTVTYDGSSQAAGLKIYLDGQLTPTTVERDALTAPIRQNTLELGSRSRDAGFRSGLIDEATVWRTALTSGEVAVHHGIPQGELSAPQKFEQEVCRFNSEVQAAWTRLQAARQALEQAEEAAPKFYCMEHSDQALPSYVLTRGQYDQPNLQQRVTPSVPQKVFPWSDKLPANRLGLAQWLTDPRHPLTARVAVNRYWTQVFGAGIVPTTENFGLQGDAPTHPELLDNLAVEFQASGWNVKALLKRLVMSATFRQSSVATAKGREVDPANKWLARGPVLRLSAEMVHDQALAAAGMLVEKVGGPSVKEDEHRRGIYLYRRRTAPPDSMLIFDAGSRETCQPRRLTTNTPLQALLLLNEKVFVQASEKLAQRLAKQSTLNVEGKITLAFRSICTRQPRANELQALTGLYQQELKNYQADLASAQKLVHQKNPETAALALVCNTIFASDAAVTSR